MLTWIEVRKSCFQNNLKQFRKIVGSQRQIMAIVKSNAYGHGMLAVAKFCLSAGADWLGVVNLKEALLLRQAKIRAPIFILSYYPLSSDVKEAIRQNIDFPVYTLSQASFLAQEGQKVNKIVNIHVKIDTGASRIGVLPEQADDFIKKIKKFKHLNLQGIFTHYADSESKNQSYTNQQTQKFLKIIDQRQIPLAHAACSATIINNPHTFFNMVRVGIGLYGLWPSKDTQRMANKKSFSINLQPVLSWKTRIIQVKSLPAGVSIGYDCTFITRSKTKLAVLPVGYADGYDRRLSNCGSVLIRGISCPIRGRVCMNLIMVDVSRVAKVKAGDEAVLIGKQNNRIISADDIAKKIGTINYEVVTKINSDIPRIYK